MCKQTAELTNRYLFICDHSNCEDLDWQIYIKDISNYILLSHTQLKYANKKKSFHHLKTLVVKVSLQTTFEKKPT